MSSSGEKRARKKSKGDARRYAKVYHDIWDDPDVVALSDNAQLIYLRLMSHKGRTNAGVVSTAPARYVGLSSTSNKEKLEQGLQELEQAGFIVVDRDSQELLVRSFVRQDEVLKQPNLTINMVRSVQSVYSSKVLRALLGELARYLEAEPDLPGWVALREESPRLWETICQTMQARAEARHQAASRPPTPTEVPGEDVPTAVQSQGAPDGYLDYQTGELFGAYEPEEYVPDPLENTLGRLPLTTVGGSDEPPY